MGDGRFQNRVGIITGAASGIGAATARRLANEGARLVLADLNDEAGQALAAELGPQCALFKRCDVADHTDVERLVAARSVDGLFERWANSVPMRRAGTPQEMAAVVAFLMSDDASYVTGAIMPADGGVPHGRANPM